MEESAKRRERLKAMRMEASQEVATHDGEGARSAVSLSNPLLESTANSEGQVQSFGQSFNYYTNPMAAFSGNKQKSKVSPQDYSSNPPTGSQANETYPSPTFQPHLNHSSNQRMQPPRGQYAHASHTYTSNAPQGGNLPSPTFDFQGRSWNLNSPHPGGYRGPGSVGFRSPGPQPHFNNPGHGSGRGYPSPQPHFNNPGQGSARGYPSPQPHFNNPGLGSGRGYPSPQPHFRSSPNHGSGQGGQWFGNSMSSGPSSGRGGGRWSGQGGRRGQGQGRGGSQSHVSAEDRPDLFYNKSMVEDPWKFLEPVIWKSQKKPWSSSISSKKAKIAESPKQQPTSSSQPSLAEILAASFNEANSDEANA